MLNNITLRIAGEGGEGVISCGEMLATVLARTHHDIFTFRTYPAEIKGGPAMFQIRAGNHPVLSMGRQLDVLLAFNQEAIELHYKDLKKNGFLIYDPAEVKEDERIKAQVSLPVPFDKISMDIIKSKRVKNVVGLGVSASIMQIEKEAVYEIVKEKFASKGEKILNANLMAVDEGYRFIENVGVPYDCVVSPSVIKERKLLMSGNEAIAVGAIFAGMRFFAGYPITPASDILEFLERELPRFGGTCLQMEDEIAAITSVIGASYAGIKSMTATSGPGFSLMIEALGLASMLEIPVVVVDCQRAGPSTGLPTKTEQSDLEVALYGRHGDAPRVVMAPANVKDCFYGIIKAFNIAEKYQIPVVFLSSQDLSQRTQTFTKPKLETLEVINRTLAQPSNGFKRYQITDTGVSPAAIPGMPGLNHVITGLEHDEYGNPNQSPQNHYRMSAKRHKKLEYIKNEKGFTRSFGDEHARIGVMSWGSTEGPIEEAVQEAKKYGIEVKALQVKMLWPLPENDIKNFINGLDVIIVPELNYTGQFANLLKAHIDGLPEVIKLNKVAGLPFTSDEILSKIEEVNSSLKSRADV